MNRFAIITNSAGNTEAAATKDQRDLITGFLEGNGWHVWHWFEDLWLVVTPDNEQMTLSTLHGKIQENIKGHFVFVVIELAPKSLAGFIPTAAVPWLKRHWE